MLSLRSLYTELNEFSYNKVYSLVRTSLQAICDCPVLHFTQDYGFDRKEIGRNAWGCGGSKGLGASNNENLGVGQSQSAVFN